ncbi:MAG TPA: cupin domain-containing protein [Myxococcota bacterium]|nr:cupin domain-containing protein [Myxococcota bacterium]
MKVVRWDSSVWAFSPEKLRKVGLFQTERFFLDVYCMEPGQSQKPHAHEGCDKVYVVLEGKARVHVAGKEQELGAGEAVLAASGEVHGIANAARTRCVVLTFMAPKPGPHA